MISDSKFIPTEFIENESEIIIDSNGIKFASDAPYDVCYVYILVGVNKGNVYLYNSKNSEYFKEL